MQLWTPWNFLNSNFTKISIMFFELFYINIFIL